MARRNPLAATGLGALAAYEAGLLEPLEQPFEQAVMAVDEAVVQAPARRRQLYCVAVKGHFNFFHPFTTCYFFFLFTEL